MTPAEQFQIQRRAMFEKPLTVYRTYAEIVTHDSIDDPPTAL